MRSLAWCAVGVLAVAGCLTDPDNGVPDRPSAPVELTAAQSQRRGIEAEFDAIAAEVPEFAGYYGDANGQLVLRTIPSGNPGFTQSAALRASARRMVGRRVVVAVDAEYTIRELMQWRDLVRANLEPTLWVSLDADERANRVVVGVPNDVSPSLVVARMVALGIPQNATRVVVTEPARQLADLTDKVRPLLGGLRIRIGSTFCTLGLNVKIGSTKYVLTNSHCTPTMGSVSAGSLMSQPDLGWGIANEFLDPAYFITAPCPGMLCRYSDAALYATTTGVFAPTVNYEVARTTVQGTTTAGGTTIGASVPVTGGVMSPSIGDSLKKTGQASGTTYGVVVGTCVDHIPTRTSSYMFLCQDELGAFGSEGDSGSPVWRDDGTGAVIYGIMWGAQGPKVLFSNLGQVMSELGAFSLN